MLKSKLYIILLLVFLLVLSRSETFGLGSKPAKDSLFLITMQLSGGYSVNVTELDNDLAEYSRWGISGSLRLMWEPNNILSIGVESGWLPISFEEGNVSTHLGDSKTDASLNSIPILGVFSMQIYGVDLYAGAGTYLLMSKTTAFNETATSSEFELGIMLGGGYSLSVSRDIEIGAELKWFGISEISKAVTTVQLRFAFCLLRY